MPDQVFMTKMPLTNYPVGWNTLLRSTMGNKTWSWSILSTCCGELIIKYIVRSKKENIVDNDVFAGSKCEGRENVINSFFHKDTITCFRFLQGHPFSKTLKMSTFLVCEIEKSTRDYYQESLFFTILLRKIPSTFKSIFKEMSLCF